MKCVLALFFFFACTSDVLCVRETCATQPEVAAPHEAAGCGCGNPKRALAGEPPEGETAPEEPTGKYSRGANERPPEARGDEKEVGSQVFCLCRPVCLPSDSSDRGYDDEQTTRHSSSAGDMHRASVYDVEIHSAGTSWDHVR